MGARASCLNGINAISCCPNSITRLAWSFPWSWRRRAEFLGLDGLDFGIASIAYLPRVLHPFGQHQERSKSRLLLRRMLSSGINGGDEFFDKDSFAETEHAQIEFFFPPSWGNGSFPHALSACIIFDARRPLI